jgi:hypothetical protein
MGDYNADKNYNLPQMSATIRDTNFISAEYVLSDQWSIDSAHRVSSFRDGTNRIKLKVKFDPRIIPPGS